MLPKTTADRLIAYVKNGGHLLLGPRSGMKDEYNALQPERQPGPLVDLLGGRVEQFYELEKDVPVGGQFGEGTAKIWAEQLGVQSSDTKVLMTYGKSNGWLDGQPAVITRQMGRGSITYVGAWLDAQLLDKLTGSLLKESGVEAIVSGAPEGVEVCERTGDGKTVVILINHHSEGAHIALPSAMMNLIGSDAAAVNAVDLPAYGVAVLGASR